MTIEPGEITTGEVRLPRRVLGLLARPQAEWEIISTEKSTTHGLSRRVILPLSAIPALSLAFGLLLVAGDQADQYRGLALEMGFLLYLQSLLTTFGFAVALALIASRFQQSIGFERALSLSTYATIPIWMMGALLLVAPDRVEVIVDAAFLYGGYVLFRGVRSMVGLEEDKVIAFTLIAMLAWGLTFASAGWILHFVQPSHM